MKTNYDVIVVGGGAVGLAAAHAMGSRNASVLVLEKFRFLNQEGSSAGFSRQYRVPYPDAYMVQMALDAQPYWEELQQQAAGPLLDKVGTLWFGDPEVHSTEGNIREAKASMDKLKVPYESLTARDVEERYRFKNLPENYSGLFQADGASINLALTLQTLLKLNKTHKSVTLEEDSPVYAITQKDGLFYVSTPKGTCAAKKLVLVPGPYINDVLNLLGFEIDVMYWEMASAYFRKTSPGIQYPTWFVFQNKVGENGNQFYGFPGVTWDYPDYIRVAPDFVRNPLDNPDQRTGIPDAQDLRFTAEWVKNHMTGLDPTPRYTSTCLIALSNLANKELVLDFAPPSVMNNKNVVIYGTGWAAKFIPLLGKIVADMALDGKTDYDIAPFRLGAKYFSAVV